MPLPQQSRRFELTRALGTGGMGTVFEGRERTTGARVAVKVLRRQTAETIYHLKQEFRVLNELAHPNLVRFSELVEDSGQYFLSMELIEGQNLVQYVRATPSDPNADLNAPTSTTPEPGPLSETRQRPWAAWGGSRAAGRDEPRGELDVERLRGCLAQLASGLNALHAAGLVHRDIKPDNVLVTREGRVVLLDFGIALRTDDVARAPAAGTIHYMAPEQWGGSSLTPATDWYAVGTVLYEALTGRLPFDGSRGEVLTKKRTQLPAAPQSFQASLPTDLCDLCMDLLQTSPADRPSSEKVLERLGMDAAAERRRASFRSRLHFARDTFFNRHTETAALFAAFERAQAGQCALLRVSGESGIGKSALLSFFSAQLRSMDLPHLVLTGRCYDRETIPYRGIDLVVDALARHLELAEREGQPALSVEDAHLLVRVFPMLAGLPGFDDEIQVEPEQLEPGRLRWAAFKAFKGLMRLVAQQQPVLIPIDDAQWIDTDSAALLGFLLRGGGVPGLMVVLSQRPGPSPALADVFGAAKHFDSVELLPLGKDDSTRLAADLLGEQGRDTAAAEAIAIKASGHPLFIHELALRGERIQAEALSLDRALSLRVAELQPHSRRLLTTVALSAGPLPHAVIRRAAQASASDYVWLLFELRAENLVTFLGLGERDVVSTYHDRVRETVRADLSEAERRDVHARLAKSIEDSLPTELDGLAYHYFEAGSLSKASHYAILAAERASEKLAFDRAASLYEIALSAATDVPRHAELHQQRAAALANAGRGLEAAEAYLRAARVSTSREGVRLRRLAGEQLLRAGHLERGMDILGKILAELQMPFPRSDWDSLGRLAANVLRLQRRDLSDFTGQEQPPGERQRLLLDTCWTLATTISTVHHLRATDFQARSLLLALDCGDKSYTLRAAALLGLSLSTSPGLMRRISTKFTSLAQRLAESMPSPEHEAWLALNSGVAAMGDWNFQTCEQDCEHAHELLTRYCTGVAWEIATCQAFTLWAQAFQGKLALAGSRMAELMADAQTRGDRYAAMTLTLSPLHLVGLGNDEPEGVRRQCEAMMQQWPEELACFQHFCAEYVLAQTCLYEGNGAGAWQHTSAARTMLRRSHMATVQFQRVDLLALQGRSALACAFSDPGRRKAWLRRARSSAKRLQREGIRAASAFAALVEGAVHSQSGQVAAGVERLTLAGELFEEQGMLLHSAVAKLAAGELSEQPSVQSSARDRLRALGVKNPQGMLRLWAPGTIQEP